VTEIDHRRRSAVGYARPVRPPLEQAFPRPSVLGIVNVTPDSFSDGGRFLWPDVAVAQARRLLAEGAALVDVGGESTRPGAEGVSLDEELRRIVPVLEGLEGAPLSVDPAGGGAAGGAAGAGRRRPRPATARRGDPELAGVVAERGAYLCLMHMQGEPRTMQAAPRYEDVVADVCAFLEERLAFAVAAGIPEERICLDPGIGFGKTVEHNLELLARLDELAARRRSHHPARPSTPAPATTSPATIQPAIPDDPTGGAESCGATSAVIIGEPAGRRRSRSSVYQRVALQLLSCSTPPADRGGTTR
jgi:dihydropteroate synthase